MSRVLFFVQEVDGEMKLFVNPLKLTAKAPENGWLEYFLLSFWVSAHFQVRAVSSREGIM